MTIPGFTADFSLVPASRRYVASRPAASHRSGVGSAAVPRASTQQEDLSTCCGHYCPDKCYCESGVGFCLPSVVEQRAAPRTPVTPRGIDVCESGDGSEIAVCSCGCIAGPRHAYCLECHLEA